MTPAPRRGTKLTIGFGLVNVDVKYAPMVPSTGGRARAHGICVEHQSRLESVRHCIAGDHDVDEVVYGYETPGGFVQVDTDSLKLASDKRLELQASVDVASIDPLYFEKAYVVWPSDDPTNQQSYDLIAHVLHDTGKALVGTTVVNKATKSIVLRWSDLTGTLVAHACTYDARVAWADVQLVREAGKDRPEPAEQMVHLAEMLLTSLDAESFDFAAVVDEYGEQLDQAIERAASGLPPLEVAAETEAPAEVVDLMAALQASVETAKPKAKKPAAKRPKKVAA